MQQICVFYLWHFIFVFFIPLLHGHKGASTARRLGEWSQDGLLGTVLCLQLDEFYVCACMHVLQRPLHMLKDMSVNIII